jgi:hypothetical protein
MHVNGCQKKKKKKNPLLPSTTQARVQVTHQRHVFTGLHVTTIAGATEVNPEGMAMFSGGGFSPHFVRPAYQGNVVPKFLQHLGG